MVRSRLYGQATQVSRRTSNLVGLVCKNRARVLLRFGVVYFGLYSLATQIAGGLLIAPGMALLPALGTRWPMRQITEWWAAHVFSVAAPVMPGNSADTLFHWVQMAWLLAVSTVIAAVWFWFDRGGADRLRVWFRLLLRLALAAQMF